MYTVNESAHALTWKEGLDCFRPNLCDWDPVIVGAVSIKSKCYDP